MFENEFLLKLDLQRFADGEDDDNDDTIDDDLFAAIKAINSQEDETDEDDLEDDDSTDDEDDDEDDVDDEDDDETEDDEELDDEDEDVEDEPVKKVQSKEDNAKFAAQRRQAEIDRKVQEELAKIQSQSPEFLLAKQLSEQFGKPAAEIMAEMEEARLQQEAKDRKLPVELLRERQADQKRIADVETELNQLRFENWQTQINTEGARLLGQYTMLTQEDIASARDYILNVAKNVNLPLEDAVYAVHGKKIIENMAKSKVQDDLAKQSGRSKKTPLPVNNGKASKVATLTADEKAIAKAFGMTADDYLKYKS